MKITLRKAKALQTSIYEAINALPLNLVTTFGEFDNISESLAAASAEYTKSLNLRSNLWKLNYRIRSLVGVANADSGISTMLCNKALLEKLIADLDPGQQSNSLEASIEILTAKQEKLRKSPTDNNVYSYRDSYITTGLLTKDEFNNAKKTVANFKKQKQELVDKLLEVNIKTEIELTDDDVALLKQVNIL